MKLILLSSTPSCRVLGRTGSVSNSSSCTQKHLQIVPFYICMCLFSSALRDRGKKLIDTAIFKMTLETESSQDLWRGAVRITLFYAQRSRDLKGQVLGLHQHYGQEEHRWSKVCLNLRGETTDNESQSLLLGKCENKQMLFYSDFSVYPRKYIQSHQFVSLFPLHIAAERTFEEVCGTNHFFKTFYYKKCSSSSIHKVERIG